MQRRFVNLPSPAIGRHIGLLAFGHYGAPMIAFPSGGGQFYDFESNGMVDSVRHLIEGGKLKLYCPESLDNESWLRGDIDPHWRGVRHQAYEDFLLRDLVPFIRHDCHSPDARVALVGCSVGAYHAANFGLKHPHVFPYALCMSGRYDLETILGFGSGDDLVYFNNPMAYLRNLHGDGLDFLRHHAHLVLVCGQGAWEHKCLAETHRLADLLVEKGISHQRDIWGHDVEHHWHWWRKQFPHHLGRALS
jgi:esterase/lipase superfamily enzyme